MNVWRLILSCCLVSRLALATSPAPPEPFEALAADLDRAFGKAATTRDFTALRFSLSFYATSFAFAPEAALAWLVTHDACFTSEEAKPLFEAFREAGVEARVSSAAGLAEAARAQRALQVQDRRASLLSLSQLPVPALLTRLSSQEAQQRFLGAARSACASPCTDECYLVWLVASRIEPASRRASSGVSPDFFEQLYRLSRMSAR